VRKGNLIAIGVALLLLVSGIALATGAYDIGRSVVSGGGGERSSDNYIARDVIGEAAVGTSESDHFLLRAGFLPWAPGPTVLCGDVDCDGVVTMNDGRQIFMYLIYGEEKYPLCNSWAADCDGIEGITMNDGRQIFMYLIYSSENYPLQCKRELG